MLKSDFDKPQPGWKQYALVYCSRCDKKFYRKGANSWSICSIHDKQLKILKTYNKSKFKAGKPVKIETLSHIRTLPNGKLIGITNKGNIVDNSHFRKELKRDPYRMEYAGMRKKDGRLTRKGKQFPTRSDFKK